MNKKGKNTKKNIPEKGITLVALVITIVILIILATITIQAAFGDGGLIEKAQQSKNTAEEAVQKELDEQNVLMSEYANIMAEDPNIPDEPNPEPDTNTVEEPEPGEQIDGTLAVGPQISDGMTPVKYIDGIGWVKTTETDEEWYNYGEKKWANIVLGDSNFNKSGNYEVLNENLRYSMLVWIPRYAYKITSMYHQSGSSGGNIEIVFLDTENKDKNGKDYNEKTAYPSAQTGSGMTDYVVHPSFDWDGVPLAGYWVGKFETSELVNNIFLSSVQIAGGERSWRDISISDIYEVCTEMNESENRYGLSTDDNKVDPHMMKNSEWGAVAYLAQSKYGKNSEVSINDNSSYYTGGGSGTSYRTNVDQSTTGNTTGIYDMSGGTWEYVAGYVGNGNNYGSSLVRAPKRYKDTYSSYTAPTTSGGHYGDAIWETSSSSTGSASWYNDYSSNFPLSFIPYFVRGGENEDGTNAGLFCFDYGTGASGGGDIIFTSFRVVIPVIQ